MDKRRRLPRSVVIVDREVLARGLDLMIKTQFGGNLLKAAREVDLEYPTLHRLVRGGGTHRLRRKTYERAVRLLGPHWRFYREAFLAGNTLEILEHHRVWVQRQRAALIRGGCGRRVAPLTVEAELSALSQHVKTQAPGRYERLHVELRRRGHSEERIALAWLRVLMPLVQAAGSGFVERSWIEMKDGELRSCLDAGIKIELTLLSRPPDLNCAQEISEMPLRDLPIHQERQKAVKRGREHIIREGRERGRKGPDTSNARRS